MTLALMDRLRQTLFILFIVATTPLVLQEHENQHMTRGMRKMSLGLLRLRSSLFPAQHVHFSRTVHATFAIVITCLPSAALTAASTQSRAAPPAQARQPPATLGRRRRLRRSTSSSGSAQRTTPPTRRRRPRRHRASPRLSALPPAQTQRRGPLPETWVSIRACDLPWRAYCRSRR